LVTSSNCFWQAEHLLCQQVLLLFTPLLLAAVVVVEALKAVKVAMLLFKKFWLQD
jgi:hypothetical protein